MSEGQLERLRKICFKLPETEERLSHGEETFFVKKRVFAGFSNNHHNDGRVAVWLPAPAGMQEMLVETEPETFFRPPYVGHKGWIGVILEKISDQDLEFYIRNGWRMVASKKLQAEMDANLESEIGEQ
jgi:hypothetical protein